MTKAQKFESWWEREMEYQGFTNAYDAAKRAWMESTVEWPADLTRERLEELACRTDGYAFAPADALRRLALLAPTREKRKVDLWRHDAASISLWEEQSEAHRAARKDGGWRWVGEAEIDA